MHTEFQAYTDQTYIKWYFRIAYFIYAIGIIIGLIINNYLSDFFLFIFVFTSFLFIILRKIKMKTQVDLTHLKINHPFMGKYKLPLAEIASIEKISFSFPNNRRTFHKKLGALYRMYGNEGVLVKTTNNTSFFLGSQQNKLHYKEIQQKLKMSIA